MAERMDRIVKTKQNKEQQKKLWRSEEEDGKSERGRDRERERRGGGEILRHRESEEPLSQTIDYSVNELSMTTRQNHWPYL